MGESYGARDGINESAITLHKNQCFLSSPLFAFALENCIACEYNQERRVNLWIATMTRRIL